MKPVLIIISPYYKNLAELLHMGAEKALQDAGCAYAVLEVPGAFEIPAAISIAATANLYDGFVALGAVIRGETTHYDHICAESTRGLQDLAIAHRLAIGNGILTCETEQQAIERADPKRGDKGGWAAKTCVAMMRVREQYGVQ